MCTTHAERGAILAKRASRYASGEDESFEQEFREYLNSVENCGWTRGVSQRLAQDESNPSRDLGWWFVLRGASAVEIDSSINDALRLVRNEREFEDERTDETAETTVNVLATESDRITVVQITADDREPSPQALTTTQLNALYHLYELLDEKIDVGIYTPKDQSVAWQYPSRDEEDAWSLQEFHDSPKKFLQQDGSLEPVTIPDSETKVDSLSAVPVCDGVLTGVAAMELYSNAIDSSQFEPTAVEELQKRVSAALDLDANRVHSLPELIRSSPLFTWIKAGRQRLVILDPPGVTYGSILRQRMGRTVSADATFRAIREAPSKQLHCFSKLSKSAVSARRNHGILPSLSRCDEKDENHQPKRQGDS